MAYTQVGIVNLALYRIGVKKITTMSDDSVQAIKANDIWEYVRDMVLQARDWKFAKVRAQLTLLDETPLSNWDYAYLLPDGFLRLAYKVKNGDPVVYPESFDFSIESMALQSVYGSIPDFDPTASYASADRVKVGPYCTILVTGTKALHIQAPFGDDDADLVSFIVESNTSDTLSVTESEDVITIKLANSTSTKNTALLIQTAIRALGTTTGNSVSVADWKVTENAAYTAARPTTGVDTENAKFMMGSGGYSDQMWVCTATVTAAAGNSSLFPPAETSYWDDDENIRDVMLMDYSSYEAEEVVIQYIRKITDVTRFSPVFVDALAWRLGADLSVGLTEGLNKFKMCMGMYEQMLIHATEINQASEEDDTPDPWSEANRAV